MSHRIILLGPPGAGKGTQAVSISKALNIPHISTGDMMREAVQSGSALGVEVKRFIDAGELVPDATVLKVVEDRLSRSDCSMGFLLDGFPRTLAQAEGLEAILKRLGVSVSKVVNFQVPDEIVIDRIMKRGHSSGRTDDNQEVARKRLEVFKEQTAPLVAYYGAQTAVLMNVSGVGSIDEVFMRVVDGLDQVN